MITNAKYMCHMWHKQASVNRWIGKQVKKILLETFKTPWMKFQGSKVFLKELIFSQMLKGFCWNIPERLPREVHLSVTLAWKVTLYLEVAPIVLALFGSSK